MFQAVRPYLIAAHRWIGVALAPVFLVIILSGAVLSFRPIVADVSGPAPVAATVDPAQLARVVSQIEAKGPVQSVAIADGGRSLDVAGASAATSGRWSVATGAPQAATSSSAIDVFGVAERIHKSLAFGFGFLVEAASWAMLAAVCAGPFLAALQFRRNVMGWHRLVGWALLPLVLFPPLTAVLMTLGIGHGGVPLPVSTHPLTISQALTHAAPSLDLAHLTGARMFRGGSVMVTIGGADGGAYAVSDAAIAKLSGGPGLIQQIHEGTWAGAWSGALNFAASLALLALTVTGLWSFVRRARADKRKSLNAEARTLVAYASQTGAAARLAAATAKALENGGEAADLAALDALKPDDLRRYERVLLLASSTGDGELPQGGARFVRRLAGERLAGVRFALLGLGDRAYADFCGGAEMLRAALLTAGAWEVAPMARADGDPTQAWSDWLETLRVALRLRLGESELNDGRVRLRLRERVRLDNPGAGDTQETWALTLESEEDLTFRPGDLVCVAPRDGGRERRYSIGSSSRTDARRILLTVTLHCWRGIDGEERLGRVSGELIRTAIGQPIVARIEANAAFNPPDDPACPIIMIGTGSGAAPFPGFLDEREASGRSGPAWLVFGNRRRDGDFLWRARWEAALARGSLAHLDVAFSRDDDGAYVQQRLEEHADELRRWIREDGARVYICGRRAMAQAVRETIARCCHARDDHAAEANEAKCERVFVDAFN